MILNRKKLVVCLAAVLCALLLAGTALAAGPGVTCTPRQDIPARLQTMLTDDHNQYDLANTAAYDVTITDLPADTSGLELRFTLPYPNGVDPEKCDFGICCMEMPEHDRSDLYGQSGENMVEKTADGVEIILHGGDGPLHESFVMVLGWHENQGASGEPGEGPDIVMQPEAVSADFQAIVDKAGWEHAAAYVYKNNEQGPVSGNHGFNPPEGMRKGVTTQYAGYIQNADGSITEIPDVGFDPDVDAFVVRDISFQPGETHFVVAWNGWAGDAAPAASNGTWVKDAGGWWYRLPDGSYPADRWQQIGGVWYWFGADGYMATGWRAIGGAWYWFDGNGAMVTGWKTIGGTWYWFDGTGAMAVGWRAIGGAWYWFDGNGAMATGWRPIGGAWYWFDGGGAMVTGWRQLDGVWYWFDGSGAMAAGWRQIGGVWYWFDASGAMATGWRAIGGTWYWFEGSGAMATGWRQLGGAWYWFDDSGAMATGVKYIGVARHSFDSSGVWQGEIVGQTVEEAYVDYVHEWLLAEMEVNSTLTSEMVEDEFMPLIKAGDYTSFPAEMIYSGMLVSGKALTFDEFAAQYKS